MSRHATTTEIAVAASAAAAHPDLRVLARRTRVADREAAQRAADERWRRLHERWRAAPEAELLGHPHVRAYRDLCRALGADPDRQPPSVVALVNRGLRGRPPDAWPRIDPIVDVVNAVAVETLTSLGVFDAARIEGQLRLALTTGREPFLPLGRSKPVALDAGELVLRDDARVLSLFARRDGVHQAVRAGSEQVVLLGCAVPGVESATIADALREAGDLLGAAQAPARGTGG